MYIHWAQIINILHDWRKVLNPNHLFLGTNSDNYFDCVKKGRWNLSGGGRPLILTVDQKEMIKELYATGNYTLRELAESYNVNYMTIQRTIKGYSYDLP